MPSSGSAARMARRKLIGGSCRASRSANAARTAASSASRWPGAVMRRQFGQQRAQHRRGIADQRAGGAAEAVDLLRVDVEPHDRQVVVHAPDALLPIEPRADRQHRVGVLPQCVALGERHRERVRGGNRRRGRGGTRTPAPAAPRQPPAPPAPRPARRRRPRSADAPPGRAASPRASPHPHRPAAAPAARSCGNATGPVMPQVSIAHSSATGPWPPAASRCGSPRPPAPALRAASGCARRAW